MMSPSRRPGRVVVLFLISLTVLIAAFALAVNSALLHSYRVEMRGVSDAAANAAVATLVNDDVLRGDLAAMPDLLERARTAALTYAAANRVQGSSFLLDPDADIMFGTLDHPFDDTFVLPGDVSDPTNPALLGVNSVRVRALRSRQRGTAPGLLFGQFTGVTRADIQIISTVTLDRDVIGFRPTEGRAVPLAPLALFSDPSASDSRSWENQIVAGNAPDAFAFDPSTNTFSAGTDGLREFPAELATDSAQVGSTNVAMLSLGVVDVAGLIDQLLDGITPDHLAGLGGQFVLDAATNQLAVDGTETGPSPGTELNNLHAALEQLRQSAQPRIWPLYCGVTGGQPVVCGFVAGRVVTVDALVIGQPLRFAVQPTSVSEASAVTDAARRGIGSTSLPNPFIARVRFVE